MAIKTLRTSGGDFSSISSWMSYLESTYNSGNPMTSDEILRMQPGQTFATTNDEDFYFFAGAGVAINFNGNKIIIETDPTYSAPNDIATVGPAAFVGRIGLYISASDIGPYAEIKFRNCIWATYNGFGRVGGTTSYSARVTADNVILLCRGIIDGAETSGWNSGELKTCTLRSFIASNCCFVIYQWTGGGQPFFMRGLGGDDIFSGSMDELKINNSIFFISCNYIPGIGQQDFTIMGTQGVHKNNVLNPYDIAYSNKSISLIENGGGGTLKITTSDSHGWLDSMSVKISGTVNYDGTYVISSASGSEFYITKAYVSNETSGSARAGYLSLMSEGTMSGSLVGDIGFADKFIPSWNSSMNSVISAIRANKMLPTSQLTLIYNNADAGTATTTDMLGTSRT